MTDVALVPVAERERDAFFAMFDAYRRELDAYDPFGPDTLPLEWHREAMLGEAGGQEWLWIVAGGRRAGLLVARTFEDEPGPGGRVTEIAECYIEPGARRRGLARAAVEALLARERERGTALVEAAVLRDNAGALVFWEALGFTVRSIQTARRP